MTRLIRTWDVGFRCGGPTIADPLIGAKPFLLGRFVDGSASSFPIRIGCEVLRSGMRFDDDAGTDANPIDCFRLKPSVSST